MSAKRSADSQAETELQPIEEFDHLSTEELESIIAAETRRHWSAEKQAKRDWAILRREKAEEVLARRRQPRSPIKIRMSKVAREEVTWLWQDRIPIGKLTMIEGDPGLGKSWLTLAIGTAISRGSALPGDVAREAANVLLMTAEDGLGDTIRPRLEDMGADLDRVIALRGMVNDQGQPDVLTLADLDVLEQAIVEDRPRLVIVDPIIAFTAGKDTSKANEVRGLLSPLASLAEKHGCAIVAVRHLNKSAAKAFYRGQGTIDFIAACRSAFVVGEDPENSEDHVLCHLKSNLAPRTPSLLYTISKGIFGWKGTSTLTADQVLAVPENGEKRTEQDDARDLLRMLLADGPVPSPDVIREAKKAGISERTLWRAKTSLKVRAQKKGFGKSGVWLWSLDQAADPHTLPKDASFSGVADMAALGKSGSLSESEGWEDLT